MNAIIVALVMAAPAPQYKAPSIENVEGKITGLYGNGTTYELGFEAKDGKRYLFAFGKDSKMVWYGCKFTREEFFDEATKHGVFKVKVKVTAQKGVLTSLFSEQPPETLTMPRVED